MTVEFRERRNPVPANQRGTVQLFLENDIDDDVDVRSFANAAAPRRAVVTAGWHEDGGRQHLTVEVWNGNTHLHTAHVFRNGQLTAFS